MAIANPVETDKPLHESFDNGIGGFNDNWNVDASVPGQVTLTGISGMLEPAKGISSGHGYGTYTVTAKLEGNMPGPAILLWPGDNKWPGQEINLAEVTNDGTGRIYGALHWDDNGDHAVTQIYSGIETGVFHNFQLVWEPGLLTYFVNGAQQWTVNQYVPLDFDNGGMNNSIGWLNNNPNTSITVTQVDYVPLGVTGTVAAATPAAAPPATTTAVDWDALAAQAAANFAATGRWYYDDPSAPATTAPAMTTPPATITPPATTAPVTTTPVTTPPTETPPPVTTPAAAAPIDWAALAAQATANYEATGQWYYDTATAPGTTTPTPEPTPAAATPVDWDALAAQASANFAATGYWFY